MKMKIACLLAALLLAVSVTACSSGGQTDTSQPVLTQSETEPDAASEPEPDTIAPSEEDEPDLSNSFVFPLGNHNDNDNFQGDTWMSLLHGFDEGIDFISANVTFAPCSRNSWHTHEGGQVLFITAGTGYHQILGEDVEVIQAGDVVVCPPGATHWHGATQEDWMVHIAVTTGATEWLEPLTEEEYNSISE